MKKTTKEILGLDDRWLILFGIPLVSFLVSALMFGNQMEDQILLNLTKCSMVSIVYTTIFWLTFRQTIIFFRRRFPRFEDSIKRLVLQVSTVMILYVLIKKTVTVFLDKYLHPTTGLDEPPGFSMVLASLTITFLILAVYEGIYFYSQLQRSVLEKEQLERENLQSQLEGLKNQVNPHFLFNSLNTLTYIIPEDSDLAVRFVQKLSKVYRYILEIRDKKVIDLSEELEFLKSYIFLLKERFGDNLVVKIDIPQEKYTNKIVPLSLQILMENAIKHNIISSQKPLEIVLEMDDDGKLVVRNNLQRKNQVMNSTKVGLQNIKNRYGFFTDKTVDVQVTAESFVVMLPLLSMKEVSIA